MTAEQMALFRKARASLAAARALHGLRFFDFAASRAYYAMFYIAEAMLLGEGLSFSASSAEFMGEFWLGKLAKCVI